MPSRRRQRSWPPWCTPVSSEVCREGSTRPLFLSTLPIQALCDESINRDDSQADSQRGHQALSAFPICLLRVVALLMLFTKPDAPMPVPRSLRKPSNHCLWTPVTPCHGLPEFNRSEQPVYRLACSLFGLQEPGRRLSVPSLTLSEQVPEGNDPRLPPSCLSSAGRGCQQGGREGAKGEAQRGDGNVET